jgi:hypothetical protein
LEARVYYTQNQEEETKIMKMDSKKILTIGAGAVVGYLLFCKMMKKADEKSLEEGAMGEEASAEEGGIGGGGGGGGFGGGGSYFPPVVAPIITPIIPSGYTSVGNNTIAPLSGLNPNKPSQAVVNISTTTPTRETPPSPPPTPTPTDISGAPVVAISKNKFVGYDGNMNQDSIL